jgi:hypothetical protein
MLQIPSNKQRSRLSWPLVGNNVARASHLSDGMLAAEAKGPGRLKSTNIIQKVQVAKWQLIYEQLKKEDL